MAKKYNNLRLESVNWAQTEITNRRPSMEPAAVFMMQIRSSRARIAPVRKRLPVFMDPETRDVLHAVKIRHGV